MIKEILILNEGGIGLFYQNFEEKAQEDYQLLASFFSAIQNFAHQATQEHLNAIISGENKYCFYKAEKFSVVLKSNVNVSEDKIKNKVETLTNSFYKIFEDFLKKNETRTEHYNGFEEVVVNIFNINVNIRHKSSEIFKDFLGISDKRINFKKIMNGL